MSPDDRRLSALLAAFVPARASELAALVGGPDGDDVRAATAALVRAGRSARLAELACALAPPQGTSAARVENGTGHRARVRLRARFQLELASQQAPGTG